MSQILALELSDQAFGAIQRQAQTSGITPARLIAATLERQFGQSGTAGNEAEKQAAREHFERHFGEVDLGHPTGTDNQGIDDDLATEYASTHEAF